MTTMTPAQVQTALEALRKIDEEDATLARAHDEDPEVRRLTRLLDERKREVVDGVRDRRLALGAEAQKLRWAIEAYRRAEHEAAAAGNVNRLRKVTMRIAARIVRKPHEESGVVYMADRYVLARYGCKELQWACSGKFWSGGNSVHGEAYLLTRDYSAHRGLGARIHEGGRLSRKLILSLSGTINSFFGIPDVAENLDVFATLIIEDALCAACGKKPALDGGELCDDCLPF